MAKARIGHYMEARVLEALEVDYIDESEVLTPADEHNHIDKFRSRFRLSAAPRPRRSAAAIGEGAAMIRTKGEAGTGNIVEAVRHMREITASIKRLTGLGPKSCPPTPRSIGAARALREVAGRAVCRCPTSPPAASRRRPMRR